MSRLGNIERELKAEHWREFHALLMDRRRTIDDAHAWLTERGYDFSRSAVARYHKTYRESSSFWLRLQLTGGYASDEDVRRTIANNCEKLTGQSLTSLAVYASFLLIGSEAGPQPATTTATPPADAN